VEEYKFPITLSLKEELLREELRRIRQTASFRFGNLLVKAIERPWRLIFLPFSILKLIWILLTEESSTQKSEPRMMRNCIVLFSINSQRGLHFDRCEAIIQSIKDKDIQIFHITTHKYGVQNQNKNIQYYTFPERSSVNGMNPRLWNHQCEVFLNTIFDIYSPKTFIFDGNYPFRGMLNAMGLREEMNRFWIRESSQNFKISSLPIDGFEQFDAIIHPSISKTTDTDINIGRSGSIFCNPIISHLPSQNDCLLFREKYLPLGATLLFFDIGIKDEFTEKIALRLLSNENVFLLVRQNMKILSVINHPRTICNEDLNYSGAMMVSDAAILYPDYYSIHTSFHLNIPTLSIADEQTTLEELSDEFGTDDLPLIYLDSKMGDGLIDTALGRLIDSNVQAQLKERMLKLGIESGTEKLAKVIMNNHN